MLHTSYEFRYRAWLIPSLYAAFTILLGFIVPRFEGRLFPGLHSSVSLNSAVAIYSAIASGMIALTGIVFSLSFVMVQFSASAYSPRLALWLVRDPFQAHALGVFIATFVYAIAALAWVDRGGTARVPLVSSLLVLALLLASMGMFIALIERIGMLQVNRMLAFTGDQGRRVIASTYPPLEAPASFSSADVLSGIPVTQTLIHHGEPQAVQSVNMGQLSELAALHDAAIEVVASIGDTLVELTPVLHVIGGSKRIDEKELRSAFEFGEQRTFHQDPKYAIRLLVDIAIKALSPAINDPTTATQALDQIGDLLVRLGLRRIELGEFRDRSGTIRVVVPFPTWDDFLRLSFDEIRTYGAGSVQVMRRMRALVNDLIAVLPEERHPELKYWRERLQETVTRSFPDSDDKLEASLEDRQGLGTTRRRYE